MITYIRQAEYPDPEDVLYYQGRLFRIEWYYTAAGDIPALDYYQSLGETDQERLDLMVKYLADNPPGTILPKTMYRVEDKARRIYAFKPRDERFFNFSAEGGRIIITNAYHKHSQKMSRADLEHLETAAKRRADYLNRVREGTYYED